MAENESVGVKKEKKENGIQYAVFEDRGRQHKAEKGVIIYIDYRDDVKDGEKIEFGNVLMLRDGEKVLVGQPTVVGAKVIGHILCASAKDKKILVFKYRRRNRYKRRRGHRQKYTEVLIDEIITG